MAKKRGKSKPKSIFKKQVKKVKTLKKATEKTLETQKPMKDALQELEILEEEKMIEHKVENMEKKEAALEQKESAIMTEEKNIEKETENVERLEKDIKKEVVQKPLAKLGIKDLNKGIIGAFIGVVAHFAFIYGKTIATQITLLRASILLAFSYILIIILMYETGYREIKEKRLIGILPKRATVIYLTSIIMIPVIFLLFNQLNFSDPVGMFKEIAVTSVLASVGAGTADLIGRD